MAWSSERTLFPGGSAYRLRRGKFSKPLVSSVEVLPCEFFPTFLWALRIPASVLQDRWDAQPTGKQSLGARLHCCGLRHFDFVIERPEIPALGN